MLISFPFSFIRAHPCYPWFHACVCVRVMGYVKIHQDRAGADGDGGRTAGKTPHGRGRASSRPPGKVPPRFACRNCSFRPISVRSSRRNCSTWPSRSPGRRPRNSARWPPSWAFRSSCPIFERRAKGRLPQQRGGRRRRRPHRGPLPQDAHPRRPGLFTRSSISRPATWVSSPCRRASAAWAC